MFYCDQEPAEDCGGLTTITRNSEVFAKLDPKVVQKLEEKQVRYSRYLPSSSKDTQYVSWQSSFYTDDTKVNLKAYTLFLYELVVLYYDRDGDVAARTAPSVTVSVPCRVWRHSMFGAVSVPYRDRVLPWPCQVPCMKTFDAVPWPCQCRLWKHLTFRVVSAQRRNRVVTMIRNLL